MARKELRALWLLALLPLGALSGASKGPSGAAGEGLVVRVAQGLLRGKREQRPYAPFSTVYAFEGVPYARPPVDRLRFQDPEEQQPWNGVRNATSFGNICIQQSLDSKNVSGSEDCLFLNIYTTDPPETWKVIKRPVMVYIHGGAFLVSSGNTNFDRPDPLLRRGILIVTINYRLGVMGFLSTEDSQAPGNAGLKDQTMALRWVQKNIAAFGGDPSNVTIMGWSAGAASVHFHMMSPLSRGLFHKAISVSGSALISSVAAQSPRRRAAALRRLFNDTCRDLPDGSIVACLQRIDAEELVLKQFTPIDEQSREFFTVRFLPSVEKPGSGSAPFLTAAPDQLLREGRFTRVPYMTGFTTAEGIVTLLLGNLLTNSSGWAVLDDNFEESFIPTMPTGLRTQEAVQKMRSFYLGDRSLRDANENRDTLQRAIQLFTDIGIALGTVNSAEIMAKQDAPVYVYQFSRDGPIAFAKNIFYNMSHISGVAHGDDLPYVFDSMDPVTDTPRPVPSDEQPLRDRQANIFANMIKTGNPTPPGNGLLQWPLYTLPQDRYMDMDVELKIRSPPMGERIDFWRKLASSTRRQ